MLESKRKREGKRCLMAELQAKLVFNHAVNVGEMCGPETAVQIASVRWEDAGGGSPADRLLQIRSHLHRE